jgi:hypothetical protein
MATGTPPLWRCPSCGRTFAQRRQTHTCAPLRELDDHFTGCRPEVRQAFDAVLAAVRSLGPVEVLPERTRIALHVRMSFAALAPRRQWLDGHLVLARRVEEPVFRRIEEPVFRRIEEPVFRRIEEYSPRNVVHVFRLAGPQDVDERFRQLLAEAYRVGRQEHLRRAGN